MVTVKMATLIICCFPALEVRTVVVPTLVVPALVVPALVVATVVVETHVLPEAPAEAPQVDG
jgi:hypothetical protein